jgi:xanthine dehydrogenase accessory factor
VLAQSGVSIAQVARIKGPIGLIPATRDPRSLAVSVLAEILALAQAGGA